MQDEVFGPLAARADAPDGFFVVRLLRQLDAAGVVEGAQLRAERPGVSLEGGVVDFAARVEQALQALQGDLVAAQPRL
jgi:hypothetical protein